jgi:hypothetical protein
LALRDVPIAILSGLPGGVPAGETETLQEWKVRLTVGKWAGGIDWHVILLNLGCFHSTETCTLSNLLRLRLIVRILPKYKRHHVVFVVAVVTTFTWLWQIWYR